MTPMSHIVLDRRRFLGAAAGFIAAGLLPKSVLALAGPYTFKQGTMDVTVVSDGHLVLPTSIIAPDAPPDALKAILEAAGVKGDTVMPETNAVLIRTGSDLILFDNGSGTDFQPTAGKLMESLKMAGVEPSAITRVVFTHAHPDHAYGTLGAAGLNYPNAAYSVAGAEWDFWMDPELINKMPEQMHAFVKGAQKHLGAIKDKVTMVKPGDDIVTGIRVLDTAGHTPGHVSFEVAGGEGLIIMGDVVAVPAVGFPHPDWRFGFDGNPELAIENRKKTLERAAADKLKLIGFHWPYPGVGYAETKDTAFTYVAQT